MHAFLSLGFLDTCYKSKSLCSIRSSRFPPACPQPPPALALPTTVDMDLLPEDVLVDILRCLPPRSLAASRCVCTPWRAAIDAYRLLRADLLPFSLDGIMYEGPYGDAPLLFSRRSTGRKVASGLKYVDCPPRPNYWVGPMVDCRNGLLLLRDQVANPATQKWAQLPLLPHPCMFTDCFACLYRHYLVFDPTVSLHYEVFLVPDVPFKLSMDHTSMHMCRDKPLSTMEWPPSPYIMHVFSSKTGCWKQRSFIREGEAIGTVANVIKSDWRVGFHPYYSAYWQGALYINLYVFVLRINLSCDKYQVIKPPKRKEGYPLCRIGKSEKGVYGTIRHWGCKFQVWFLDESRGQMEWVLRNEINLEPVEKIYCRKGVNDGPWIVQSNHQMECVLKNEVNRDPTDDNNEALAEDNFEWDSDNENVVGTEDWPRECDPHADSFSCLGFHPYKEIVLFCGSRSNTVLAYHLNSSKVRYLGRMKDDYDEQEVYFPYTPYWTRELPGSN